MAFNDAAVFTAATGYLYLAPVGTAAPTPEELNYFDPDTFGAATYTLKVTGKPTTGTFKIKVGSSTTEELAHNVSAAKVQAELAKLQNVGTGNVAVKGESLEAGYSISFIGEKMTDTTLVPSVDSTSSLDGSAKAEIKQALKANDWVPLGHTSDEDLPEFGFEGGDRETRGTWQKKTLKEVTTETPVDYMTVKAQQFDSETLALYYGKNASQIKGVFGVDRTDGASVEKAVLMVMVDGEFKIGFSAAKSTVRRDESISLATDSFSTLPLRSTFLKAPGRHLYEWIIPAEAD